jgi:hypothetical protein
MFEGVLIWADIVYARYPARSCAESLEIWRVLRMQYVARIVKISRRVVDLFVR